MNAYALKKKIFFFLQKVKSFNSPVCLSKQKQKNKNVFKNKKQNNNIDIIETIYDVTGKVKTENSAAISIINLKTFEQLNKPKLIKTLNFAGRRVNKIRLISSSRTLLMQRNFSFSHFQDNLPLVLATDASLFVVGAVSSYIYEDGSERPIAFASKTLDRHQ